MSILSRLVIGTAAWAKEYNGHKVSEKEQQLIMEYMKDVGIEWLDVATAYGTKDIGKDDFYRIVKTETDTSLYNNRRNKIYLSHKFEDYDRQFHDGFSVDDYVITCGFTVSCTELPFSIMARNEDAITVSRQQMTPNHGTVIARSIFCKGKALKYFSPQECIDFVLMNPRIDKVIIGVDSADQLRENVAHLVKMEKFTHNEEVDTRKFERKDL